MPGMNDPWPWPDGRRPNEPMTFVVSEQVVDALGGLAAVRDGLSALTGGRPVVVDVAPPLPAPTRRHRAARALRTIADRIDTALYDLAGRVDDQ